MKGMKPAAVGIFTMLAGFTLSHNRWSQQYRGRSRSAEILLNSGVTLRVGENGSFRIIANRPDDTRIEVLTGPADVLTDEIANDAQVTVICEDAVTLSSSGAYRFDNRLMQGTADRDCEFKIYRGAARVRLATLNLLVKAGHLTDLNRRCEDHMPIFADIFIRQRRSPDAKQPARCRAGKTFLTAWPADI